MIKVNIFNETKANINEFVKVLKEVFKKVKGKNEFSVVFVEESAIKKLNNQYRSIDEVTDVLSFPSEEDQYLGDVFICLEKALNQAEEFKHTQKREIAFLAVHGFLHLKGYDHLTKETEAIMNEKTEEILKKVSLTRDENE